MITPQEIVQLIARLRVVPSFLREGKRFVVWKYVWKNGKRTKVPYNPITGQLAKTNDPNTWCDFETAIAALYSSLYDGIGIVLTNSTIVAFDIDNCRNPETGEIDPEVLQFLRWCNSYHEITPSGIAWEMFQIAHYASPNA